MSGKRVKIFFTAKNRVFFSDSDYRDDDIRKIYDGYADCAEGKTSIRYTDYADGKPYETEIFEENDSVSVCRRGDDLYSRYVFRLGEKTDAVFRTEYGDHKVGVCTKELSVDKTEGFLKISIGYSAEVEGVLSENSFGVLLKYST